ncbi:MAG: hypothetical protein F4W95_06620 [Chloroflexi bacterium]|nr:hypothetical protein [Chloroflexota bacterium]MYD48143.1 hypothetical protein [Chloroflexota bacterium]
MRRFTNAKLLAALVTTASLLSVALLAGLAYRPSAPVGQDDAAATAEPTAAAEFIATFIPKPSSTASPSDKYLEPMVHAFIRQANQDAGASGAAESTVRVIVEPNAKANAVHEAVHSYLIANGAARVTGKRIATGTYNVPVSLLAGLAQHPQVGVVLVASSNFPYPSMDRTLNNVVAAWQNGATPEEAARLALVHYQDKVVVLMATADSSDVSPLYATKTILDDNDVYVDPEEYAYITEHNQRFYGAFVPVNIVPLLAQVSGVEFKTYEWTRIPSATYTEQEQGVINELRHRLLPPSLKPTRAPTPTPASGVSGQSGAVATSAPEPTPTLYLIDDGTPRVVDHPVKLKYPNLGSHLSGLAEEYEEAQSSDQGASGQGTPQVEEVDVIVTLDSAENTAGVVQFLKNHSASPLYDYMGLPNDGYGYDTSLAAIVPVSLLVSLAGLPGVVRVEEPGRPGPTAEPAPGSR